jgi:hypothetical protein
VPVLNDRDRALRELYDLGPAIALGGHRAPLGQDEGGQGQGASAGRVTERAGEDRISPGRIAFQQIGDALGVQHRRPVRTRRTQPVPGDLRVTPHGGHAIATQYRAQVRQRPLHRASVGQDPRGSRTFRGGRPALGRAWLAEESKDQRAVHRDRAVVLG